MFCFLSLAMCFFCNVFCLQVDSQNFSCVLPTLPIEYFAFGLLFQPCRCFRLTSPLVWQGLISFITASLLKRPPYSILGFFPPSLQPPEVQDCAIVCALTSPPTVSPEPLQRAGININYGRVGKFPAMCQILNRDMCKSLPQHSGLPTHFQYVPACAYVRVCD